MDTNLYYWSEEVCTQQIQINVDGRVSIVDGSSRYDSKLASGQHGTTYGRTWVNSENWFRVRWAGGSYPTASTGCDAIPACRTQHSDNGESCVCEVDAATTAVFTDVANIPTKAELEEQLHIGAHAPEHFDAGIYERCTSAACVAASPDVIVYTRGTASQPRFDETSIFEIVVNATRHSNTVLSGVVGVGGWGGTCTCPDGSVYQVGDLDGCADQSARSSSLACYGGGVPGTCNTNNPGGATVAVTCGSNGRILHFANKASLVTISNETSSSAYQFRNPPHMTSVVDPSARDALYETDALLDHIFYHQSVAPFVAHRVTQRLTTSNPSPRYMSAVTTAFNTGEYNGRAFSGEYGDLGAMVAAILLDREARSLVLTADPMHGQLREPIVKLFHFMRAMEYTHRDYREVELTKSLVGMIGQGTYKSPGVFSFFLPEFQTEGAVLGAGLTSPEGMLLTLPYVIGFMDALTSLVFDGLSSSNGGFGTSGCRIGSPTECEGFLGYIPTNGTAVAVIDELDLVLSAGRLDAQSRSILVDEYNYQLNRTACPLDKTADFCGRLTPGQHLLPGEAITNSLGEELCFSYDGVARHISADGRELFSTAFITRETGYMLWYVNQNSRKGLAIRARHRFDDWWRWESMDFYPGNYAAFASFMSGPCDLQDAQWFERVTRDGFYNDGTHTATVTCDAPSTCSLPSPPPPSVAYETQRLLTDSWYPTHTVQNLMALSSAFSITNEPAMTEVTATTPPANPYNGAPYKALVVLFLAGGADTFNMLIPHSNCDSSIVPHVANQYVSTRGGAGLAPSSLHTIQVTPGTQVCDTFGLHPDFTFLHSLWNDGDASFVANVGALAEPITKEQYFDRDGDLPTQLFAHNIQTLGAHTLNPLETTGTSGVLGRILQALEDQATAVGTSPHKAAAYSINNVRTMFRGGPVEPVLLSEAEGMLTYEGSWLAQIAKGSTDTVERGRTTANLARLSEKEAGSIFAESHNSAQRLSIRDSERIGSLLSQVTLTQDWAGAARSAPVGRKRLIQQFEQVARVIGQRIALQAERDIFYVELGGFDAHADLTSDLQKNYQAIDTAIQTFTNEMKAAGLWDQVAVQTISEFGRTMTTNGQGTDHAWGGNHFLIGGQVSGQKIHGTYPQLAINGPNSISNTGVMLPTSPWETIWKPLAQWLGVQDDQMTNVFPNYDKFPNLLSVSDAFLSS